MCSCEIVYNLSKPTLTTVVSGENETLYMSNLPEMEEVLRPNLDKTFQQLGFVDRQEIRMPVHFKLLLT